ncbi:MAG: hypothetical protein BWY51_00937 [Parcubacteria group bacterium ADurb.Bin316]|nr:MAG: hypothetical protein BWY51_00937 [Parcubacteria group bacterium ADurb.Bin316]HOZ55963.1 hypothetical protein [bacterium]
MTLTPEQFNKLAAKEDLKDLEQKITEDMGQKLDNIMTAVDGLTKNVKDIEHGFVSNQAAHDRFEELLARIEKHLDLKPMFNFRS